MSLSVVEAVQLTGRSATLIYRWVGRGELPGVSRCDCGCGSWRLSREAIRAIEARPRRD